MSQNRKALDEMIMEVLQENLDEKISPLKVINQKSKNRVKFGDEYFTAKKDQQYALSLAAYEAPPGEFGLADIKKLLIRLRSGSKSAISSKRGMYRFQLEVAKELVDKVGDANEKKDWHIALFLLQKNYNLDAKLVETDTLSKYTVLPDGITPQEFRQRASKGTWIGLKVDPAPAKGEDNINLDVEKQKVDPEIHSLFSTDLRNAQGEEGMGSFPTNVQNAIRALFTSEANLYSRLKTITDFSNEMSQMLSNNTPMPSRMTSKEIGEAMAKMVLLDYITSIVSDMDDGSGAYLFETFLAALAGGRVEGKEKTAQGKMGATDFTFAGGVKGSAKYYSRTSKGYVAGIHQAIGGFSAGDYMHYLIGVKNKDTVAGIDGVVKSVDIYYYKILLTGIGPSGGEVDGKLTNVNVYAYDPDGNPLSKGEKWQSKGGEGLDLGKQFLYSDRTKLGTVSIIGAGATSGQKFKERILAAANQHSGDLGVVLQGVSNIVKEANDFKSNTTKYTMQIKNKEQIMAADAAIGNLNELNEHFQNLYDRLTNLGYGSATKQSTTGIKTESKKNLKKSLKDLDKLIEQVILYKNTEEK